MVKGLALVILAIHLHFPLFNRIPELVLTLVSPVLVWDLVQYRHKPAHSVGIRVFRLNVSGVGCTVAAAGVVAFCSTLNISVSFGEVATTTRATTAGRALLRLLSPCSTIRASFWLLMLPPLA